MPFSFKQFHIDDSRCGMPVSTDGVMLGAWANIEHSRTILDIGAGSGLLTLMAAQRAHQQASSAIKIVAVELDDLAAQDCLHNIANCPWAEMIEFHHGAIQDFSAQHLVQYKAKLSPLFDSIICNPPYFDNGPQSKQQQRATARHTESLSFSELLKNIALLLAPNGAASLILPVESEARFTDALTQTSLAISKRVSISTVINKPARRLLLELKHQPNIDTIEHSSLVISDNSGQYSQQMITLCREFYLKL
ncbi:tRNA1(Val) (adenine(37)-N6)-methyltransferase [Shewanella sp. 10N.286.48.B5]|uniref:tRNA1(Val) (adenine(37)-N6)-methyltransferase n=1 Tax=Shewanella sp. 10N.286.48.B5 TaxID=1880834 RepID=UPI000C822EE5|nr:methyltransferase [Shewanella sp. 10N.286.48.B5]PMH85707.1 hypothetical protein BCU57_13305 [Shewanella sp. 10N.286.48.B5]